MQGQIYCTHTTRLTQCIFLEYLLYVFMRPKAFSVIKTVQENQSILRVMSLLEILWMIFKRPKDYFTFIHTSQIPQERLNR